MPFLPCLLSFFLLHSFSFLCYFSFNSLCFLSQSLSYFHLWLLVLFVTILFSHLLHIFFSLKMPMHHLAFQHIFTSFVHICINQRALILIFLLLFPLYHSLCFIFSSCFFHFCILAKSLILAIIDWDAQNWPKFHLR